MKRMNQSLMMLMVWLLPCAAEAQTVSSPQSQTQSATRAETAPAAQAAPDQTSEQENARHGRWSLNLMLSNVFSSNIDQDEDNVASYGLAPGIGIHYRNRSSNSTFEFDYELTSLSFTRTDEYDRVSHNVRASFAHSLTRRLKVNTTGDFSFNGSTDSDERNTGDQYTLAQAVAYRLNHRHRLRVFGAYRIKRFRDDPDRNAINPYFGGKFEQRLGGGRRWELGYRYDWNRAASRRGRYIRWTYSAGFTTPLSRRDRLTLEAKYRPQLYARQIGIGDERVPRRDQRWILSASWRRSLWRNLGVNFIYIFETRASNDRDRKFREHLGGVALTYRWGK